MTNQNQPAEDPAPTSAASAPEEPFPHLTNHPSWGVRSPTFFALFFAGFILFSLWVIYSGVTGYASSGDGAALFLAVVGVGLVGIGGFNTYMGVRRMQWKRDYERVMGRSPW